MLLNFGSCSRSDFGTADDSLVASGAQTSQAQRRNDGEQSSIAVRTSGYHEPRMAP